ncbi:MAG TPA: hypothetical protein VL549_06690 [Gemmatimonadales bacterium]|nr:hypothetical protein [Gemmatimonadales bacterium]
MPATAGMSVSHPNHPVLLPADDGEDDPLPLPPPRLAPAAHWYDRLAKPSAYVASGLAGAVLVTAIYGLLGSRAPTSGNRNADVSAAGAVVAGDTSSLDRRADTLSLAIEAFALRARMFETRRMACTGLARGLQQVEDGWLAYNMARKGVPAGSDPARDARDRDLYANVRSVELRFERSSCQRP